MEERNRNEVLAVIKACDLLDLISKEGMVGLSELTRKSGLKKTTVSRLLSTLKKVGFVNQDEATQKFFLSMRMVSIADRVLDNLDLRSLSRPLMEKFVHQHGRTIILAILKDHQITHVDSVEGRESYRIITTFGEKVPPHCTASGKAILAYLPPEKRRALAGDIPFETFTSNTITDWSKLEQELNVIKQRGYAIDFNERFGEIVAVAVPIFGHSGEVIGAITNPKVASNLDEATIKDWGKQLVELGRNISIQLGWEAEQSKGTDFLQSQI